MTTTTTVDAGTPAEPDGPTLPDMGHLVEGRRGLGDAIAWLEQHWHGLPAPYWSAKSAWDGSRPEVPGGYRLSLQVMCNDRDTFAAAVRRLAEDAGKGEAHKHADNSYMRVTRRFGPVELEVWTLREVSCTARVVGTTSSVETAVRCTHCNAPIQVSADNWWHVAPDAGRYGPCLPDSDTRATPPNFAAMRVTARDVVEWDCEPLLDNGHGAQR